MPYASNSDLPKAVRDALPGDAQTVWRTAYTTAEDKWPGSDNEGKRAQYAWGAVSKAFKKGPSGKWVKKSESDEKPKEPWFVKVGDLVLASQEDAGGLVRGKEFHLTDDEGDRFGLRVIEDSRNDPDNDNYHIVIATAGRNDSKKRWYLNEAFESLPETGFYDRLQMHLDHAGKEGEALGVRSVGSMAAVITDSWRVTSTEADDGVARYDGMAHVFANQPGFRESMRDPEFRQSVFVSHVADISGYYGQEAGADSKRTTWQCIQKIDRVYGVDWVTRPGARGRVAESEATNEAEDDVPEIKDITLAQLREGNPALVKEIEDAVTVPLQKQIDELRTASEAGAAERRKERITAAVNEGVKDKVYGIPEAVRETVAGRVIGNALALKPEETEGDKLDAVVKTALTAEANDIARIQGRPEVVLESGAPPEPTPDEKRKRLQQMADRLG